LELIKGNLLISGRVWAPTLGFSHWKRIFTYY